MHCFNKTYFDDDFFCASDVSFDNHSAVIKKKQAVGVPLSSLNNYSAVINLDGKRTHLELLPALPQLHHLLHALLQHNTEHGVVSASSCVPHQQLAAFAHELR